MTRADNSATRGSNLPVEVDSTVLDGPSYMAEVTLLSALVLDGPSYMAEVTMLSALVLSNVMLAFSTVDFSRPTPTNIKYVNVKYLDRQLNLQK